MQHRDAGGLRDANLGTGEMGEMQRKRLVVSHGGGSHRGSVLSWCPENLGRKKGKRQGGHK